MAIPPVPAGSDPATDQQPGQRSPTLEQRIREIAYLMWEAAGYQHGRALEYWLAAEQEVLATLAATARALAGGDHPAADRDAEQEPSHQPADDGTAG